MACTNSAESFSSTELGVDLVGDLAQHRVQAGDLVGTEEERQHQEILLGAQVDAESASIDPIRQ